MYKSLFYKTLGVIIITFLLYRLLILERISYTINEKISFKMLIIITLIIVSLICELISVILLLKGSIIKSALTLFIIKYINKYYYIPLLEVGKIVYKKTVVQLLLEIIIESFKLIMLNKYLIILNVLIVFLLPRAFLGYALYVDINILSKICLFYKLLWIIIIPLFFQAAFALLKHVNQERVEQLNTHIKIFNIKEERKISPQYKMPKESFKTYVNQWEHYQNNIDMLTAIELAKNCKIYLQLRRIIIMFFISLWLTYIVKVLFVNKYTFQIQLLFYNYYLSLIFI